jgi:integrase/recombinase XerD
LNPKTARAAFARLVVECGLPARPRCGPPRLHDLRHSFAVHTLIDVHRAGADVDARLATLATFLGHAEPANTYWYLTASPELMAAVAHRSETCRASSTTTRCRP